MSVRPCPQGHGPHSDRSTGDRVLEPLVRTSLDSLRAPVGHWRVSRPSRSLRVTLYTMSPQDLECVCVSLITQGSLCIPGLGACTQRGNVEGSGLGLGVLASAPDGGEAVVLWALGPCDVSVWVGVASSGSCLPRVLGQVACRASSLSGVPRRPGLSCHVPRLFEERM